MQTAIKNPDSKIQALVKNSFLVKPTELEFIAEKVWGHEEWIINHKAYCGKRLIFKAGYQCSMHHHKIKDETFYVQSGTIILETELDGVAKSRVMTKGDTAHMTPLMWHRISAIESSEIIEFSTFHMEEDSYRRTKSGKADFKKMGFTEYCCE